MPPERFDRETHEGGTDRNGSRFANRRSSDHGRGRAILWTRRDEKRLLDRILIKAALSRYASLLSVRKEQPPTNWRYRLFFISNETSAAFKGSFRRWLIFRSGILAIVYCWFDDAMFRGLGGAI